MQAKRTRFPTCMTFRHDTRELLKGLSNKSEYVERLIHAYPPPGEPKTLRALALLVQARHPWVMTVDRTRAREGLPTFGGQRPTRPGAASWDRESVMDEGGNIFPRRIWEAHATGNEPSR